MLYVLSFTAPSDTALEQRTLTAGEIQDDNRTVQSLKRYLPREDVLRSQNDIGS
jgi:hypothetical protein